MAEFDHPRIPAAVKQWNGITWGDLAQPLISIGVVFQPFLTVSPGGALYLGYGDFGANGLFVLRRFDP
jgi:hypothetical protein